MNDSKSGPSGDGRLTVVLFLLFGLLLFDFTYSHHWSFFTRINGRNSAEQLSFVRPNKLVVENYTEGDWEQGQGHELILARYTPFFFELIPINSADKYMLMTIKGIVPALADDIVAYRDQVGPFKQSTDLRNLRGIGAKRATKFATTFTFTEVP